MNDCVSNYIYGDSWGNLSQVIQDPHVTANDSHLARTITMLYDVSGRVLQSTDPAIQTSAFIHNNLGRPTSAAFPAKGAAPAETFSCNYGVNGRIATFRLY